MTDPANSPSSNIGPEVVHRTEDPSRPVAPSVVGARVQFRADHPTYPGMVGTVTAWFPALGVGVPQVEITLDPVTATADEIEPESMGVLIAKGYAERMFSPEPLAGEQRG